MSIKMYFLLDIPEIRKVVLGFKPILLKMNINILFIKTSIKQSNITLKWTDFSISSKLVLTILFYNVCPKYSKSQTKGSSVRVWKRLNQKRKKKKNFSNRIFILIFFSRTKRYYSQNVELPLKEKQWTLWNLFKLM